MTAEQKYDREFGQKVAAARTAQEVSQRALSSELSKLGISLDSAALSRLEQGKRAPKLQEAEAIATVLQVSLQDLLPDAERSPVDELGRAWGAVQKSTDDALYKLTGLAGQLDHFADLIEAHPDAADAIWGTEGPNDWPAWVKSTAQALTRYASHRAVFAEGDRRAELLRALDALVQSVVVEPSPAQIADSIEFPDEPFGFPGLESLDGDEHGEHQAEA